MSLNKKVFFLIICAVIIILEIVFSQIQLFKKIDIKNVLEVALLVVSGSGIISESKKAKNQRLSDQVVEKNYRLNVSFESGLYGGLIGGILSGTLIAFLFYNQQLNPSVSNCLKIIPYCAIGGCLLGGLLYAFRSLFSNLKSIHVLVRNFLGCLFACLVAGVFSGMLGMWLFGNTHFDFVGFDKIILGSIIGSLCLIIGTLIFDYEGKTRYIIFSLLIGLVISTFVSMIGFLLANNKSVTEYLEPLIYSDNLGNLLHAGVIIGLITGFVMGLIVGFTVVFYKYWRFAEKQEQKNRINPVRDLDYSSS